MWYAACREAAHAFLVEVTPGMYAHPARAHR